MSGVHARAAAPARERRNAWPSNVIGRPIFIALAALIGLPIALVVIAMLIVQSEWAERWVETRVGERLGREVQIDEIDIDLGWPPAVNLGRLRIGNPPWARTPSLVDADGLHARVAIPPLFRGQVVIPFLSARKAAAGLEIDGPRATWRFGDDEQQPSSIKLSRIQLEDGVIVFRDEGEKTALDIKVSGSLGQAGELKLAASGRFGDEVTKASATIPSLEPSPDAPIQLIANANIGKTEIAAKGTITSTLDTLDLDLRLGGQTLKDLRKVFRMNLPDTPPYKVAGHLRHTGTEWLFNDFAGRIGDSDVQGDVTYRTGGKRPFFQANVKSKLLDLDDLGPIIGTPPKTGPGETASAAQRRKAAELAAKSQVLPHERFSTADWDQMDADVTLDAQRVLRPKQLPIDSLATHVILKDSVLRFEPLSFGVAGGRISGTISLDGRTKPVRGNMEIDFQGLQLARLFPESQAMKEALGTLYGRAKLAGRGESVAELLGTSNGPISLAVNGGQVNLLLVELLGLDLAEAVALLGTRNRQIRLRCAVADLTVKDGVATPQAFVIDTSDTVVTVTGPIDLRGERLDLVFHPEPKDPSIFALRSPIHLQGAFKDPTVRPEIGPIAARIAGAALRAAVNPLLALLPFIETGPGKDSDCAKLIGQVRAKGAIKKQ